LSENLRNVNPGSVHTLVSGTKIASAASKALQARCVVDRDRGSPARTATAVSTRPISVIDALDKFLRQRRNDRRRQNDDVGRVPTAQFVGHGADAELALDVEAGQCANLGARLATGPCAARR
jgi:hypothetical protein